MILRDYHEYFLEIFPGYSLLPVIDPMADPFRIHIVPPYINYNQLIFEEPSESSIKAGGIKTLCGLDAHGYVKTMSGILTNKRWKLCSTCRERAIQLHISASEDSLYGPILQRNKAYFYIAVEGSGAEPGVIKRHMVFEGPSREASYFNWFRRIRRAKEDK